MRVCVIDFKYSLICNIKHWLQRSVLSRLVLKAVFFSGNKFMICVSG